MFLYKANLALHIISGIKLLLIKKSVSVMFVIFIVSVYKRIEERKVLMYLFQLF